MIEILSYEAVVNANSTALQVLEHAFHEQGIIGIRGIPEFREKTLAFIEAAKGFSALPEAVRAAYRSTLPPGQALIGYEQGNEKFMRSNGEWVVDESKDSYYAFIPDHPLNKWPVEIDLKTCFQNLGMLMSQAGIIVMNAIGLLDQPTGIDTDNLTILGRMLHYRSHAESYADNPLWCGTHCDHGLFTALLPGFYFSEGRMVAEPEEAGLFVKSTTNEIFNKIQVQEPDILLLQVGEFAQLTTHDAIKATAHKVHKASGAIERYTMAVFFNPALDTLIHSQSALTDDTRYGGNKGDACLYRHWNEASYKRYFVDQTN